MRAPEGEPDALRSPSMAVALVAAAAVVVVLGIVADPIARLAQLASAIGS
jgi:NADH-quinone oxidoreductase subunit N